MKKEKTIRNNKFLCFDISNDISKKKYYLSTTNDKFLLNKILFIRKEKEKPQNQLEE